MAIPRSAHALFFAQSCFYLPLTWECTLQKMQQGLKKHAKVTRLSATPRSRRPPARSLQEGPPDDAQVHESSSQESPHSRGDPALLVKASGTGNMQPGGPQGGRSRGAGGSTAGALSIEDGGAFTNEPPGTKKSFRCIGHVRLQPHSCICLAILPLQTG